MTTVPVTSEELPVPHTDRRIYVAVWANLANGDAGAAMEMPEGADRSVQFEGTFDGGTVEWEGSNDGTNFHTLTDPQGNTISKTDSSISQVVEVARYMRPRVPSGGASTSITATVLVCRR
jgi:hypothetical protein